MKSQLPATLILSFALAAPSLAADKKHKPGGTPSAVPPTSPMLVVPPPDDAAANPPGKLITSDMDGRDMTFFVKAADAGRVQAYFAEMLRKSASSGQIKTLADTLATAQEEENARLVKLAGQKGLTVSLAPTATEKKTGDKIAAMSGANFDKAAMDKLVSASKEALIAYEDAVHSTDPEIKRFAAQMLPLAEEKRHLVEKMTGAGSKAAGQLFRHGGVSETTPAATPAVAPELPPKGKGKGQSAGASASPGVSLQMATPTPPPGVAPLPLATPPGLPHPAPDLPPIVPPKAPPTPVPLK
jgi:putative membrane protein